MKPCRFRVHQDRLNLSFPAVQGTPQCIKSIGASVLLANYALGVKLFRKKISRAAEIWHDRLTCRRPHAHGLGAAANIYNQINIREKKTS